MSDHDHAGMFTREFWDERYAASAHVWSGRPNARLVEHAADLQPGTALDVGCGEGADVVWLAQRGWEVTGLDVSQVALDKARRHAEDAGVADRARWVQADLLAGDPLPGRFDLVSAFYLHVPPPHFTGVYGALAAAVVPGGALLAVGHHPADAATGLRNPELTRLLFSPERVTEVLDPAEWEIRVADSPTRQATDHDGNPVTLTDTVVLAVRRPPAEG